MLRILLVGYLYGITSERRVIEVIRMNLIYRWFSGFLTHRVPHHSTFSKNRHRRFCQSGLFQEMFEQIVLCCLTVGLVEGKRLSVDGTQIAANASSKSLVAREHLVDITSVNRTVREYLAELEQQEAKAKETSSVGENDQTIAECISTTDPDASLSSENGPARLAFFDNYLINNASRVIVGVQATPARFSQEVVAAKQMLRQVKQKFGLAPVSLGADKAYGSGEFLAWLQEQDIEPHIPVIDRRHQASGFRQEQFTYLSDRDAYQCPAGKQLPYKHTNTTGQIHVYRASQADCRTCSLKVDCTPAPSRKLSVSVHEAVRQRTKQLVPTARYQNSRREGNKVEALFSELKQRIRLQQVRLRRLQHVSKQFLLAATVQNLKRLMKFLESSQLQPFPTAA